MTWWSRAVGTSGRRGVRGSGSGDLPWEGAGAASREAQHFPLVGNGPCPGLKALRRRAPRGSGMIDPESGFPPLGDAVCCLAFTSRLSQSLLIPFVCTKDSDLYTALKKKKVHIVVGGLTPMHAYVTWQRGCR